MDAMQQCLSDAGKSLSDVQINDLVTSKQQLVRHMIADGLAPLPGVEEFLLWARPRFRLSMVTSGSRGTVQIALAKLGYDGWFNPLLCADDLERPKPDPEGFLKVLKITEVSTSESLVFEDSFVGVSAAKSAGIDYIDISPPLTFSYLCSLLF
jgi:HAD superfamily hydrolase (TIGR01509 family)